MTRCRLAAVRLALRVKHRSGNSSARRGCLAVLTLVALTSLAGRRALPATGDDPIVIRDATHRELHFARPPRRIVSLLPALTESICVLEECARLVATDRFSDWPASVRDLPKAGGLEDLQVEQVVRAKPDAVVIGRSSRVFDRLAGLGIVTVQFDSQTYADIESNITTLGALLRIPERAAALNRKIERSVADVVAKAREHLYGRTPLVYYEVDPGPYGAGPESFIGQLMARLGARNILGPELGPFPKLNPEYVVRADPDVILIAPDQVEALALRPGWSRIRAVREHRICSFPPAVRDTIVRPGPRVADGLQAVADCLQRVAP